MQNEYKRLRGNMPHLEMTQALMMQRVCAVLSLVVEELDVTRTCVFSVLDQLLNIVNTQIRRKQKRPIA